MKSLETINSRDDFIMAYLDQNWEICGYLPHISQSVCHTCCTHTRNLTMTIQVVTIKSYSVQDRLWLPATVVCATDHGSYIGKVIGGAEYK